MVWICTSGVGLETRRKTGNALSLRLLHLGLGLLRAGTNVGLGLVDGGAQIRACLLALGGGLTGNLISEYERESTPCKLHKQEDPSQLRVSAGRPHFVVGKRFDTHL